MLDLLYRRFMIYADSFVRIQVSEIVGFVFVLVTIGIEGEEATTQNIALLGSKNQKF